MNNSQRSEKHLVTFHISRKYLLAILFITLVYCETEMNICKNTNEITDFSKIEIFITCFKPNVQKTTSNCKNFPNLKELTEKDLLSATQVKIENCSIKPEIFGSVSLPKLTTFESIPFTHTIVLEDNTFKGLCSLQDIAFDSNFIEEIKPLAFSCLSNLRYIYLANNKLSALSGKIFENLTHLEALYLDYNEITTLPNELFRDAHSLSYVILNQNRLQEINGNTFFLLDNLETLYMDSNNISKLIDQPFKNNGKLIHISMSSNQITEIENASLQGLSSIVEINLNNNSIMKIERYAFKNMPNLVKLDLSNNRLIDMEYLDNVPSLKYFNVEYNKITEIFMPNFTRKARLSIDLNFNNVERIHVNHRQNYSAFGRYIKIVTKIDTLNCDCYAYDLYKYMSNYSHQNVFKYGLICNYPIKFRRRELISLNPNDFLCDVSEKCPDRCSCIYRSSDDIQTVNCSNKDLTNLPLHAPFKTKVLDISHNSVTSLVDLNKKIWVNLTEIHAEYNKILSFSYLPKNLKILDLHNNKLRKYPEPIIKELLSKSDVKITISNNPWICDCSMIRLRKYSYNIKDFIQVHCAFANNSQNTLSIIELRESDICPETQFIQTQLVQYLVISAVFVFLIFLLVFYYKNKLYVLSFIYSYCNICFISYFCNRTLRENYVYDCFISYSSVDREVTLAILAELENKPPYYNFCIHERNWLAGQFITNNIVKSVQNSRKTLIILSKTFLQSSWFYLEFQAAYQKTLEDKVNGLIIILKGDLPTKKELSTDVLHVLSSKTYLQWGEKWFWEKLRYAIYIQNDSQDQNKNSCFRSLAFWLTKKRTLTQQDIELN